MRRITYSCTELRPHREVLEALDGTMEGSGSTCLANRAPGAEFSRRMINRASTTSLLSTAPPLPQLLVTPDGDGCG